VLVEILLVLKILIETAFRDAAFMNDPVDAGIVEVIVDKLLYGGLFNFGPLFRRKIKKRFFWHTHHLIFPE
jgi:hypothetical protein